MKNTKLLGAIGVFTNAVRITKKSKMMYMKSYGVFGRSFEKESRV